MCQNRDENIRSLSHNAEDPGVPGHRVVGGRAAPREEDRTAARHLALQGREVLRPGR